MRRLVRNSIGCAALLLGTASVGCGSKPAEPTAPAPGAPSGAQMTPPVGRGPAAFKTTIDALTKEVLGNEKAAQAKYNGKVVEVEGAVEFANKVLNANGFSLQGAKRNPTDVIGVTVICNVPKGAEGKAWRLSAGQKVKATGTVALSSLAVYFNDCAVEPLEPASTTRVSAKELTEQVVKDADAARKKYQAPDGGSKELIVEGVVAGLEKSKNGFCIAKLAGSGGVTVNCTMDEQDFAALKAGDAVVIKGDFSNYYPNENQVTVNTAFVLPKE